MIPANSIRAFQTLITKYSSITAKQLSELKKKNKLKNFEDTLTMVTGFARTGESYLTTVNYADEDVHCKKHCTLCIAARKHVTMESSKCDSCVWSVENTFGYSYSCINDSYYPISEAKTFGEMVRNIKKRVVIMKEQLKLAKAHNKKSLG
jgi:hypothetical protein